MITEDYVSFEIAKLLNEKGFDEPCFAYYSEYWDNWKSFRFWKKFPKRNVPNKGYMNVPTIQMTMKWLREFYKLYIQIMLDSWALGSHSGYYIVIQATDSDFEEVSPCEQVFYKTYEEACEAAIKYCLENLI